MKKVHPVLAPVRAAALILFALACSAGAADNNPPDRMTYQSYLVDNTGTPLGNTAPKNYDITFRIWSDAASTDPTKRLWSEAQTVTVDKGYFSVALGEGSTVNGELRPALASLFYATDASDRYIEMSVTGVGVLAPRLRLMPSPYAFLARYASYANYLVNSSNTTILAINGNNIGINRGATPPSSTLDVNGAITATNLTVSNNIQLFAGSLLGIGLTNTMSYDTKLTGANALSWENDSWDATGPTLWLSAKSGFKFFTSQSQPAVTISKAGDLNAGNVKATNVTAAGTVTATTFVGNGTIPVGGIIMWSGATNAIPAGWALCDGQNNTPNLTNRFVIAAGGAYAPKATGGNPTQTLSQANLPPHSHNYTDNYFNLMSVDWHGGGDASPGNGTGGNATTSGTTTGGPGTSAPFDIMPPYYALAYIMRIR